MLIGVILMTLSIQPTLFAKENEAQAVVDYLQTLIKFNSVTPYQAGAIDWLESDLIDCFECEQFTFNNVTNLIAKIHFGDGPIYAFSGHIDVVPATAEHWCVGTFLWRYFKRRCLWTRCC